MNPRRLFTRIVRGSVANVAFSDMRRLVEAFGFGLLRVKGSHYIFGHPNVTELLNLQEVMARQSPTRFGNSCAS